MKTAYYALFAAALTLAACSASPMRQSVDTARPHLKITVVFNPEMYQSMMFKKMYPTYAVWVEDQKTGEVKTVYITGKAGKGKWIMADERPSSVPVWYGAAKGEKKGPSAEIDGITSATPSGKMVTHLWQVPDAMAGKALTVYIEGNVSFDYNEFYRKDAPAGDPGYSDVNGQPSLVWKAVVQTGLKPVELKPAIAGHGHVLGANHGIDPDLSKITTAKEIFKYLEITYIPGAK